MLLTKIINGTDWMLEIKEGTAVAMRRIATVGKDKSFTVKVDGNATYREYLISSLPECGDGIVLSSDDCQEYSEITIYFHKEHSELYYEGKRRNAPTNAIIGQTDGNIGQTDGSIGQTGEGGTSWFSRLFRKIKAPG